ncbi:MAG: hypothetical protein V9G11_00330 [Bifidobacterium adolescentis]
MSRTSIRWISGRSTKLVLLTQTTLSVDETAGTIAALKCAFPVD